MWYSVWLDGLWACCDSPVLQAGPFQALQQRDGERAGRPGPRGLPGAQHRRANTGQESPVRLFLPKALVRAGVRQPVHRVPPHRPHTGTVGLQRGNCAMMRKKLITQVLLHWWGWCSFKLYSVFWVKKCIISREDLFFKEVCLLRNLQCWRQPTVNQCLAWILGKNEFVNEHLSTYAVSRHAEWRFVIMLE